MSGLATMAGLGKAKLGKARLGSTGLKTGLLAAALFAAALLTVPASALASAGSQPAPWQIGLQNMASPLGVSVYEFHNYILMPIIVGITLFVLGLIAYVAVKFNERAHPSPSRTTHNTAVEVAWTVIPVLILVAISIPGFRVLRNHMEIPRADLTIKAIGKQWYWTYEYPPEAAPPGQAASAGFTFDSIMLQDAERATKVGVDPAKRAEFPRLLAVDNEAVVPLGKTVVVQTTGADVIHAFAMPSFGVKADSIPGRLNQVWFRAEREGIFYGQCSELCGTSHAFMPIAIRVVSEEAYARWIGEAKTKFASLDGTTPVASKTAVASKPAVDKPSVETPAPTTVANAASPAAR